MILLPGALPHLLAGCTMYFIGRYHYKEYFGGDSKTKERLLLAVTCLIFSFIADFVLIIYYLTYIYSFDILCPIHSFVHFLFLIFAIISLFILVLIVNIKRKPIWIMGMWTIILHVLMDFVIPDSGIWI